MEREEVADQAELAVSEIAHSDLLRSVLGAVTNGRDAYSNSDGVMGPMRIGPSSRRTSGLHAPRLGPNPTITESKVAELVEFPRPSMNLRRPGSQQITAAVLNARWNHLAPVLDGTKQITTAPLL